MKLNQVIALVSGKKKKATEVLTAAYHSIQKAESLNGLSRVYSPKDDDGDKLPSETKIVENKVTKVIGEIAGPIIDMMDMVLIQDVANTAAIANIEINGQILAEKVPVTHLLFLEKQVTDLKTFISKLPTLDHAEQWSYDTTSDCYMSKPTETTRTKKVPKAFVKAEATDKFPSQVETYTEDILVGYWKSIKFSGAIPASDKNAMLVRATLLHEAIIKAREEANSLTVNERQIGQSLLGFIFS